MTVDELINELKQMPENAQVRVVGLDEKYKYPIGYISCEAGDVQIGVIDE